MTIRVPKVVLLVLGVLVLAGGAAAAYFAFVADGEDEPPCYSEAGTEVDCSVADAMTDTEYVAFKKEEARKEAARARAEQQAAECESQLGDFQSAVQELDSRLAVGLSFDEYSSQVGNIRVVYDQVPFGQLGVECVSNVGLPLEEALNDYAKAQNTWGDCIDDFGCDTDSIDPELQSHWNSASSNLDSASRAMRQLGEV